MLIQIDSADLLRASENKEGAGARIIRSAAYFLLASIGDIPDETEVHTATGADLDKKFGVVPTGTNATPFAHAAATAAAAPVATGVAVAAPTNASNVSTLPIPPAPPAPPPPPPTDVSGSTEDDETEGTNTGNVPPPPPASSSIAGTATSQPTAPPASGAAAAGTVASVEVDSVGMPWDERIHQKGKSKKKDNTWKLKKGVDMALVQTVTAELAARRAAAPTPTAGSLPLAGQHGSQPPTAGSTSVPVPPVPNDAPAPGVPSPNGVGASVPVPPVPAVGSVGASDGGVTPYRKLIDKITELTKANKITPAKVSEICQANGSPSLMKLKEFENLIPAIDRDIDAAALGLL